MCSSHEEKSVEFTNNPYKAGMRVHHKKNKAGTCVYHKNYWHNFGARSMWQDIWMDREERLR